MTAPLLDGRQWRHIHRLKESLLVDRLEISAIGTLDIGSCRLHRLSVQRAAAGFADQPTAAIE